MVLKTDVNVIVPRKSTRGQIGMENNAKAGAYKTPDYDFTYRESEREQNWYFWDEYIQYVLAWMFG